MYVHESMTADPVTISPQMTCSQAFHLMRENDIHRLPVTDEQGYLVGIVAESDLLFSGSLSAARLSILELDNLFDKTPVKNVMTTRVIRVAADWPLEDAIHIMTDNKIGSVPVMRGDQLVGIITKTDIFRVLAVALGGRVEGLRVTIRLGQDLGELVAITDGIVQLGGRLLSLLMFCDRDPLKRIVVLKVEIAEPQDLLWMLEKTIGVHVIASRKFNTELKVT